MDTNYQITHMTKEEVGVAILWAKNEGWNPGLHDAQCFYQADPKGFFAGKLNEEIIALGSAVIYDENFAFCGLYIVNKEFRNKGYGIALTKARLAYVGQRNVGIDGVLNNIKNYEQIGYQYAYNNARYCLDKHTPKQFDSPYIEHLKTLPLEQLLEYDRKHFPALRPQFLSCWINQPDALALGFFMNQTLHGYGVIRKCFQGYKIGPLFADTPEIAHDLFNQLVAYAQGQMVFLDIPENNPLAIKLVKVQGMNKVFATARMYLKEEPVLATNSIYGITTFELG